MIDPRCELLSRVLKEIVAQMQAGADREKCWADVDRAFAAAQEDEDIELFVAIDERDFDALRDIVAQWQLGKRPLVRHDRDVLKRALKAFRKRLNLVRLDAESSVGGGPMSSGRQSGIVGVRPPDQYPQEVWDELVRQKHLLEARGGTYELAAE